MQILANKIRAYGRPVKALSNFLYHFFRYVKYAAWHIKENEPQKREYNAVKIYHSLEKSMSYKARKLGSGWKDAFSLLKVLEYAHAEGNERHGEKNAKGVLEKFISIEGNYGTENQKYIAQKLKNLNFESHTDSGTQNWDIARFNKGKLEVPEDFFLTRYSLREFSDSIVTDEVVQRVLKLAIKTPSVCNRQPWHIYTTNKSEVIDKALSFQNGNRGFGHKVPNLAIICADLRAFMGAAETYQHWIDGGLFSMSTIYAFHALGVASCCLNWSANAKEDRELRKYLNINPNHSVIMMLAYGYPEDCNTVCISNRRAINEIYSTLEFREI